MRNTPYKGATRRRLSAPAGRCSTLSSTGWESKPERLTPSHGQGRPWSLGASNGFFELVTFDVEEPDLRVEAHWPRGIILGRILGHTRAAA